MSIGEFADSTAVLEAAGLEKRFHRGPELVHALRDIAFSIRAGEVVGLIGPSGSGKTTLLHVICGWEQPDAGTIRVRGATVRSAAALSWREVAIVPQDLALLEELSVGENVTLPLRLSRAEAPAYEHAVALLEELGLAELVPRVPIEASLGEQQRAALARAVVARPALLLADEPTAHQDERWTKGVMRAISAAAAEGTACLVATHSQEAMPYLDRVLVMNDGGLVETAVPSSQSDALDERFGQNRPSRSL